MEFSTERLEKMADLIAEEMVRVIGPEEAILGVEEGMRELLCQVGKRALGKYVSQAETPPVREVV